MREKSWSGGNGSALRAVIEVGPSKMTKLRSRFYAFAIRQSIEGGNDNVNLIGRTRKTKRAVRAVVAL